MKIEAENQSVIALAVRRILRPLVRVLLRHGLPHQFLADLSREVYVEVARNEFALPGRKPSDSRIAILTGLSRKAVLQIRRIENDDADGAGTSYNRAARIISVWMSDPEFLDEDGEPAKLNLEGERNSFASLVRQHSGDMPARAVADELIRVGAIERTADERMALVQRGYVPALDDKERLSILGRDVSDLINTIDHNLTHAPDEVYFQRKVAYNNIPQHALTEFRSLSSEQSQQLLELLDSWLAQHDRDRNPDSEGDGTYRVGVGIYYFEEQLEQLKKEEN